MNELEKSFTARGIVRGGILLLEAAPAVDFIEEARNRHARVLGVNSFIVSNSDARELSQHILDLSLPPPNFDSWSSARQFVEERARRGFMFEVVV